MTTKTNWTCDRKNSIESTTQIYRCFLNTHGNSAEANTNIEEIEGGPGENSWNPTRDKKAENTQEWGQVAAAAAAVLAPLFLVIGELYNELETIFESSTLALHTNSEAKTMFTSQQEVLDWNREK